MSDNLFLQNIDLEIQFVYQIHMDTKKKAFKNYLIKITFSLDSSSSVSIVMK